MTEKMSIIIKLTFSTIALTMLNFCKEKKPKEVIASILYRVGLIQINFVSIRDQNQKIYDSIRGLNNFPFDNP